MAPTKKASTEEKEPLKPMTEKQKQETAYIEALLKRAPSGLRSANWDLNNPNGKSDTGRGGRGA